MNYISSFEVSHFQSLTKEFLSLSENEDLNKNFSADENTDSETENEIDKVIEVKQEDSDRRELSNQITDIRWKVSASCLYTVNKLSDDTVTHCLSFNKFLKVDIQQSRLFKGKSPFLNLEL